MSHQYSHSGIPGSLNYAQDLGLIQYNTALNSIDPLGLQVSQNIVMDPSNYVNKSYNIQNSNQVYTNQLAYNQQINLYPNQNGRQTISFHQHNNFNQPQIQISQNIPQQIYYKNNVQALKRHQKVQPIIPKPQTQQKLIAPQINPLVQPNNLQGCMPVDIQYLKYIKRNPFQSQSKKINLKYNKNDEHFVNKPIYPESKHTSYNSKAKSLQKQKQIKLLQRKEILDKEIKVEDKNYKPELPKEQNSLFNNTIMNNKKLLNEEEKEIDIKQIEASNLLSQISNKFNDEKEIPIEEKAPEPTFQELMDNHNQNVVIQKYITQSGISDYVANLSHLPTINSILRGNSELLPQ